MLKNKKSSETTTTRRSLFLFYHFVYKIFSESIIRSTMSVKHELETAGFAAIELPGFDMSDRLSLTRSALEVINAALGNPEIVHLLELTLDPGLGERTNPTVYGISGPRNSTDDKVYWHVGYGVIANLREQGSKVPELLRSRLSDFENALEVVSEAYRYFLLEAGIDPRLVVELLPDERRDRNMILRFLKYIEYESKPVGANIFTPHIDLGIASIELYKSHERVFAGAPVSPRASGRLLGRGSAHSSHIGL